MSDRRSSAAESHPLTALALALGPMLALPALSPFVAPEAATKW